MLWVWDCLILEIPANWASRSCVVLPLSLTTHLWCTADSRNGRIGRIGITYVPRVAGKRTWKTWTEKIGRNLLDYSIMWTLKSKFWEYWDVLYLFLCSVSEYEYFLFKGRKECSHLLSPLDVADPRSAKKNVRLLYLYTERPNVQEETHIRTWLQSVT